MNRALATGVVLSLIFAGAAQAEENKMGGCACQIAAAEGLVATVNGRVLVSTATGLVDAYIGSELDSGSVIYTGANSDASATFGESCVVSVPPNSAMSVKPSDTGFCVAILTDRDESPAGAGIALGAGAAGGLAVLVVGANQSAPVSLE